MEKRASKIAAASLSAITIAGIASVPLYAEASENSESPLFVPSEATEAQATEEATVATAASVSDGVNTLANDVTNTNTNTELVTTAADAEAAQENLDSASTNADNFAKAEAAISDSYNEAVQATVDACEAGDTGKSATDQAKASADTAVSTVTDESTSQEEAALSVVQAETSVDVAESVYSEAQAKLEQALADYEQAKSDYETAIAAYNANKEKTAADLQAAKASLDSAMSKLNVLEEQLGMARNELEASGAGALLEAQDNGGSGVANFIADYLQKHYLPLVYRNGYSGIENVNVSLPNPDGDIYDNYIRLSYDVIDNNGNRRTVEEDYGYTIQTSSGELYIYSRGAYYEFTDGNGNTRRMTEDEVNGRPGLPGEPDTVVSYVISGSIVPRYEDKQVRYVGTYNKPVYTEADAIAQGYNAILERQYNRPEYDNVSMSYVKGVYTHHGTEYYIAPYGDLDVYYGIKYNKVINGQLERYNINEYDASIPYQTIEAATTSLQNSIYRMLGQLGAVEYDSVASNFSIVQQVSKAKYENKSVIFSSNYRGHNASNSNAGYVLPIDMIGIYRRLVQEIASAKSEYADAVKNVEDIQAQLDRLESIKTPEAAANMAELQARLDKAQADMDAAKENLDLAKSALENAKTAYVNRFTVLEAADDSLVLEEVPSVKEEPEETIEDEEEEEELEEEEEEEEIEEDEAVAAAITGGNGYSVSYNYGGILPAVEDFIADIPNIDETAPQPQQHSRKSNKKEEITVAGVLEHGKWFVGLAGVSTAGAGVAALEAKRRAAMKILDKLNS